MNPDFLFGSALGIVSPWTVESVEFSKEAKRLKIGFRRGATFPCPVCGTAAPAHDTSEKTWRHLNFFQYEAYLTARACLIRLARPRRLLRRYSRGRASTSQELVQLGNSLSGRKGKKGCQNCQNCQ